MYLTKIQHRVGRLPIGYRYSSQMLSLHVSNPETNLSIAARLAVWIMPP